VSGAGRWFQASIYPSTRSGESKVILWENTGYQWQCKEHERQRCTGCARFRQRRIAAQLNSAPVEYDGDIVATLISLLAQVAPERQHVDDDGNRYLRAD